MKPACDKYAWTAFDYVDMAVVCIERGGLTYTSARSALMFLARAWPLARKDMNHAAMRTIARMRNWLRADLRKLEARP